MWIVSVYTVVPSVWIVSVCTVLFCIVPSVWYFYVSLLQFYLCGLIFFCTVPSDYYFVPLLQFCICGLLFFIVLFTPQALHVLLLQFCLCRFLLCIMLPDLFQCCSFFPMWIVCTVPLDWYFLIYWCSSVCGLQFFYCSLFLICYVLLMKLFLCAYYTPAPPEGVYCFSSVRRSVRPKIFFVAFFSATIDGRNLIFGHKLHICMPYCGKRFNARQMPTIGLRTQLVLYILNIYAPYAGVHLS